VDRADARELQFFERAVQPLALLGRRLRPRLLDLKAQAQLHLAGGFLCERDCDGAGERAVPAADQPDDAADQCGGLAGSRSRLDEKGRAELSEDPGSRYCVGKVAHGTALTVKSASRFPCGLRAERYSSYGPQTTR
jgi:hypothetical protein